MKSINIREWFTRKRTIKAAYPDPPVVLPNFTAVAVKFDEGKLIDIAVQHVDNLFSNPKKTYWVEVTEENKKRVMDDLNNRIVVGYDIAPLTELLAREFGEALNIKTIDIKDLSEVLCPYMEDKSFERLAERFACINPMFDLRTLWDECQTICALVRAIKNRPQVKRAINLAVS